MREERLQTYKNILETIKQEQILNDELIDYGYSEIEDLAAQKLNALESMEFYVTVSFDAISNTKEKREALLNVIKKCAQNDFELPQSDNEAINIAAENSRLAREIDYQIESLEKDITEITNEQLQLENFAKATEATIKVLTKK